MNKENKKPIMQEFTMSTRHFINQDKESFVNKPIIVDGRPIGVITDAKFKGDKLTVLCMMFDKVYEVKDISRHDGYSVEYSTQYSEPVSIRLDQDSENMKNVEVLYDEDLLKIENACIKYPLGSYQIGEIARLSGLLYEKGINVESQLRVLCRRYHINTNDDEK